MEQKETAMNNSKTKHLYFEIGRELLAKPNALTELILTRLGQKILVYCNTPSDADFVEVTLKKAGLQAIKLIGNVPQPKLDQALASLRQGELAALVVTDVAARLLDLKEFSVAINYGLPNDLDLYVERIGGESLADHFQEELTIISAHDLPQLSNLKKQFEGELVQGQLPTAADVASAKFKQIKEVLINLFEQTNEQSKALAETVSKDSDLQKILSSLIHFYLNANTSNNRQASPQNDFSDENQYDNKRFSSSDYRRNNERGGNNRSLRGKDSSGNGRQKDQYDRSRSASRYNSDNDSELADDRDWLDNEKENPSNTNIKVREVRFYANIGSAAGLTSESLSETIKRELTIDSDALVHSSLRPNYSFFDLNLDKLNGINIDQKFSWNIAGKQVEVSKAILLSRTAQQQTNNQNQQPQEEQSDTQSE
ncbi:MAG TPA: DEAD/DEAH box helicase [Oligoflexia bacterium]|nr:DEAD/DEAH box helicase [Oligoflexia bacterium]HMP27192.1 DEAD/DEAH box helicase [Oligoflexia bacterium]